MDATQTEKNKGIPDIPANTTNAKGQNNRRILIYLLLNFGITWLLEFLVIWPLATSDNSSVLTIAQLLLTVVMFFPAVSAFLTRLITKEGFQNNMLLPKNGRRSIPYLLMGWFGPTLLTTIGAVMFFLIFPDRFDPGMGAMRTLLTAQGLEASDALVTMTVASQIISGVLFAPMLNALPCFGEEWGWRGYLLPKLLKSMGVMPTLLLSGIIWGLWHLPMIMLGHNYGTGYLGYPITGILAMCVFCVVVGVIFSYLTIRTGSCLPAIMGHGALNGFASAGILFTDGTRINPFIGPAPTGIIGGCAYIICAVVIAVLLVRHPGLEHMPDQIPETPAQ